MSCSSVEHDFHLHQVNPSRASSSSRREGGDRPGTRAYHLAMSRIGTFADDDVAGWVRKSPELGGAMAKFSKDQAKKLKEMTFDVAALTARRLPYERLDQLVTELLLGVL